MSASQAFEKSGNGSIDTVLNDELSAVRKKRSGLVSSEKTGFLHFFILFLCILTNCIFFLTMPDYFALVYCSQFLPQYVLLYLLLIPTNFQEPNFRKSKSSAFMHGSGISVSPQEHPDLPRPFYRLFFHKQQGIIPGYRHAIFSRHNLCAPFLYYDESIPGHDDNCHFPVWCHYPVLSPGLEDRTILNRI